MSLSNEYVPMDFTDPNTPHDRVLVVEGKKFYVYAGHLSYCSEFFRVMFNSDFKEKTEVEIEIKEIAAEDFHAFLKNLIPYNVSAITVNNYLVIMACAHRFMAPDVLAMCEKFTVDNFETLDKIEMLKMAFEYNWNELKTKLIEHMTQGPNPPAIGCSVKPVCKSYHLECTFCGSPYVEQPSAGHIPSFFAENKEKLSELSEEIHSFMFKAMLDKAGK